MTTIAKIALITGITGQDGSYLAEFLLDKNYSVHGIIRKSSNFNTGRIEHLYKKYQHESKKLFLHYGDLTDTSNLISLISKIKPNEVYHLAAQSHVKVSFELTEYTTNVNALGTLKLLEAIRILKLEKYIRFYQASTSELYGQAKEIPQTETTPFNPRSPYAISKQFAYWTVINYREAYNMHASNGILFNHESPRRGPTFVTKKITRGVSMIKYNKLSCLYLGNLNAKRDWGHAKDYVKMMWVMLQQNNPDDYVIATGEIHSVKEFVEKAFEIISIKITWRGEGINEVGEDSNKRVLVRIDPKYFRLTEVDILQGSSVKAKKKLGWESTYTFEEIVKEMMESDLKAVKRDIDSGKL